MLFVPSHADKIDNAKRAASEMGANVMDPVIDQPLLQRAGQHYVFEQSKEYRYHRSL
jgi:hypothetical protein